MRRVSRRDFLATSSVAIGTLPLIRATAFAQTADAAFRHGVASGDPLADRVILWTRVTPRAVTDAPVVSWQVARDAKFTQIVSRGQTQTGTARDFTVKVDVTGLEAGTAYYYRFESQGARSAIGRTRTLPREGVSRLRLGVVSCSNLPQGYFNAYACLARRADIDAVLHLGDYIYEYANEQYGDGTKLGRIPAPNKEMVALQDYRQRHAQYKADPDSQEVHRQHPFIVTWDDHEFTNNAWMGGAQNHNADQGEGEWAPRRAAAVQAYYEWMPIREDAPGPHLPILPFRQPRHVVDARHPAGRPRTAGRARRQGDH
jgi:alkaline phosphatase D